jgi:hypothetical protein
MQANISADLIKKLKPKQKPYEIRDIKLPGFLLRVQPSGAMSYYIELGRGRRMAIGKASVVKPLKARARADELLSGFTLGVDPLDERKSAKAFTLQEYIDERYRPWAEAHVKDPRKWLHAIGRYLPELGSKKLPDITPWLVEKHRSARLKVGITPATANRNMTALKAALNKAVEWGVIKSNPLATVKKM